jgi:hypothetical protein
LKLWILTTSGNPTVENALIHGTLTAYTNEQDAFRELAQKPGLQLLPVEVAEVKREVQPVDLEDDGDDVDRGILMVGTPSAARSMQIRPPGWFKGQITQAGKKGV